MAGLPIEISPGALAMYLILLTFISQGTMAFNLDTRSYTSYRSEPGSMFGFSVSLHRENSASWVLVGAPNAQTSQPGVTRGGAVYSCDISNENDCKQIPFDTTGHNTRNDVQIDEKNYQWFGATVYSAGENKPVVACAPRYIFYSFFTTTEMRDPVGTCFMSKKQFTEFSEYSPCRTRNWGYHRQGSCQAGFGVSISKDGERLFIGAVGSRYWQGMVISQNTHDRRDVMFTPEGPYTEDNTYLGYSVVAGDFGGHIAGHEDVAVGRPKGAGLLGQVLLFTWNMTNLQNISGEQLGSYFGYSLATSDVDGDKRTDLIIGAPFYTDLENNEGKYETGRVYIIYQGTGQHLFNEAHVKDGKNSKGRFGLAVTTLGDINRDGYGDFAVGAPYDGPDERGAVYLFHGSATGVRESYSQVVYAEDVIGSPSTFGFSLSGGIDLDENDYPDLVIGAYDSSAAVFMRARPVVKVSSQINFLMDGKQISLDGEDCTLRDGTKVPCVKLHSCLKYSGHGVDRSLGFNVQLVLDSKIQRSPRMFFLSEERKSVLNKTMLLKINEETCMTMDVYIQKNIRDKLTALEAQIRYSLIGISEGRRMARQLSPILDQNEELFSKDSISIRKNCGKDNICIPDLRLIAQPSVTRYLLGSGERFYLYVMVQNEGEDAFEAEFETTIPPGMSYVNIERLDDATKEIPVQCSAPSIRNKYTLHCDIGNPLPREKLVKFNVILQPYHQDGMQPLYEFLMKVNSTNPETNTSTSDNVMSITVPIWVETDIIQLGSSHPTDVYYNISLYDKTENFSHESEIGPQVIHAYTIRNKGPSDIVEAEAVFLWPSYTLSGEHLLYLLEQPELSGNITCEYVEEVNIENIPLDRKRKQFWDGDFEIGQQEGLTGVTSSQTSDETNHTVHKTTSTTSTSSHSFNKVLTIEQRRKLEEIESKKELEAAMKETGDGSARHHQRTKTNKNDGTSHFSSNGGRLESGSRTIVIDGRGKVDEGNIPITSNRSYFEENHRNHQNNNRKNSGGSHGTNRNKHFHYEEREESSNTTWRSGEKPKTMTSTKWKTVDDGIEKSGSSSHTESGSRNINLANLGLSSVGNKRFSLSGGGSGGTSRTYSEEHNYEKSTTWDSRDGGAPQVSESSSWKKNNDGVITSGGSRSNSDNDRRGSRVETEYEGKNRNSGSVTSTREHSRHGIQIETGSSHHRHGTGISTDATSGRRQGHTTTEQGGERNINYSNQRHNGNQNFGSSHGSSGNRRVQDEEIYTRTTSSQDHYSGDNIGHRTSGSAQRGVATGQRVEGNNRRNEGRHKIHWSSEHGTNYDESRTSTNVGEDKRGIIGSNRNSQDNSNRGSKSYSEERYHEWNTTFNSQDGNKPKTTEYTRWSVNEDGLVKNGSSSHNYEGTATLDKDLNKHLLVTNVGSGGVTIDQNLVSGGNRGTSYSEEKETTYNTSWSSGTGSKPVTRTQTNWKINRDGVVTSGSKSDVFEGIPPAVHGSQGSQHGSEHESRRHESSYNRHEDSASRDGYTSHHTDHAAGSRVHSDSRTKTEAGAHSRNYDEHSGFNRNYNERQSGTRQSVGTNVNVGDILKSGQSSQGSSSNRQSFNQFGEIARGPKGGVAKTYTLDLGIDSGNNHGDSRHMEHSSHRNDQSRSEGGRHYSSEDRSSYSSNFGTDDRRSSHSSNTDSQNEGSQGFSYRFKDRIETGGGSSLSSWSHSSSGIADGDRPQHGGAYAIKKVSDSPYPRHFTSESEKGQFVHYPRNRREAGQEDLKDTLSCGPTKCTKIMCTLGPLKKGEEVSVAFRSRAWISTIKKISTNVEIGLSSQVATRVKKLPHILSPDVPTHTHEVQSHIMPPGLPVKSDIIPLWIVVVSACAGAIILMLLVYLLYKCGFFKRNRPSNAPEKQPLNRNGYNHGDEAL